MFVEFTEADDDKTPIMINPKHISSICDAKTHREIHMKSGRNWWVRESMEEVKKRCELTINSKGNLLMKDVA